LHKALITQCRSLAASGDKAEAAFYQDLEQLAQPWLTPRVLARADQEILLDLLVRCRHAEQRLGGRSWAQLLPTGVLPALLVSFFFFLGVLGVGIADQAGFQVLSGLRGWSDDLWFAVKRSSEIERLGFAALVLLAVSIFAVARTARS